MSVTERSEYEATDPSIRAFLPMAVPKLGAQELRNVAEAVETGWISSQGPFVAEFEKTFATYCGAEHGIAVSSGTTALHLALVALGIGRGDEVILPPLTHIACINAVAMTGATPVLADCELATWGLDPEFVAAKLTRRTKAIMAVHLFGHPVDIDPILELADAHGCAVVEDAAQAHGAEYRGRRAGGLGRIGCFSFYANKIITTGEGGMLVTSDQRLAERARKLCDQAYEPDRRFLHRELGFNYRMTNLQAGIGVAQLAQIDEFVDAHRRNAARLTERLAGLGVVAPPEQGWAKNVYWMYSVLVDEDCCGVNAPTLMLRLRENGIDSRPFFVPFHHQPLYERYFRGEAYPVAELLAERGVSLPSGNELTRAELEHLAEVTRAVLEEPAAR